MDCFDLESANHRNNPDFKFAFIPGRNNCVDGENDFLEKNTRVNQGTVSARNGQHGVIHCRLLIDNRQQGHDRRITDCYFLWGWR